MQRRTLILAAGVGSGHNSAAKAVEAALVAAGAGGEVRRLDVLDTTNEVFNRLYDDAYFTLVAQVPWLVGWGYDNQDPPFKLATLMRWWEQLNTVSTVREIRAFEPDLVICTHFLPARLVSLMIARGQLKAQLAVVTTDFDFQGLWLTAPIDQLFVAREETRQYLLSLGLSEDRVTTSGIPVRPAFAEPLDADAVRARYGLPADVPVVLISAGAAGGSRTLQVVRQTLELGDGFQAVVVCGRNAELKTQVEALVAGCDNYQVLGFTDEMPQLMRISSLFVGKPGGLSSSECLAAGLPMVIIDPIPGQEEHNADYLLEEGAAVRCNYATTVGYKIGTLLADRERLAGMAANAARIGRPDAAGVVARTCAELAAPALWISREAQRSIQRLSNEGTDVLATPDAERLHTLYDLDTGASLALVAEDELATLGVSALASKVELSLTQLRALRWQPEYYTLATAGIWLLGESETRTLGVR
jgi:processive 1,2-diacylglycerol beta-glucosyltransferase